MTMDPAHCRTRSALSGASITQDGLRGVFQYSGAAEREATVLLGEVLRPPGKSPGGVIGWCDGDEFC